MPDLHEISAGFNNLYVQMIQNQYGPYSYREIREKLFPAGKQLITMINDYLEEIEKDVKENDLERKI